MNILFKTADVYNDETEVDRCQMRLDELKDIHDFVLEPRTEEALEVYREELLFKNGFVV